MSQSSGEKSYGTIRDIEELLFRSGDEESIFELENRLLRSKNEGNKGEIFTLTIDGVGLKIEKYINSMKDDLKRIESNHPMYDEFSSVCKLFQHEFTQYLLRSKRIMTDCYDQFGFFTEIEWFVETPLFMYVTIVLFMMKIVTSTIPVTKTLLYQNNHMMQKGKDILLKVCRHDRVLCTLEFIYRYLNHQYLLTPQLSLWSLDVLNDRISMPPVSVFLGEEWCIDSSNIKVCSLLSTVFRRSFRLPFRDGNVIEPFINLKSDSTYEKGFVDTYSKYLNLKGDISKHVKVLNTNTSENNFYVFDEDSRCFSFKGTPIFPVPNNFKFGFIQFGEFGEHCVCINPFFNKLLLILYKGEIVQSTNATKIVDISNGYIKLCEPNSYVMITYKGKRVYCRGYSHGEEDSVNSVNWDSGLVQVDISESYEESLRGGFLVMREKIHTVQDKVTEKISHWKGEDFRKISSVNCEESFYDITQSTVGKIQIRFNILYDNDELLREFVAYMYDSESYLILEDFSRCLDIWKKKIHSLDPLTHPEEKLSSFSLTYQDYIKNLLSIQSNTSCEFSLIPKDVLIHKILPFISQIEVFFSTHFQFKKLMKNNAYNHSVQPPMVKKKHFFFIQDEIIYKSTHPVNITTSFIVFRRNMKDLVAGTEILSELGISIKNNNTLFFEEKSAIPRLFHHFFVVNEEDNLFLRRLRIEFMKFLGCLREKDVGLISDVDIREDIHLPQSIQIDVSLLRDDISYVIHNFDKKPHLQSISHESINGDRFQVELFSLLVGYTRYKSDSSFIEFWNKIDPSLPKQKFVSISFDEISNLDEDEKLKIQTEIHQFVREYEDNNRIITLDLMNKFCANQPLMKKVILKQSKVVFSILEEIQTLSVYIIAIRILQTLNVNKYNLLMSSSLHSLSLLFSQYSCGKKFTQKVIEFIIFLLIFTSTRNGDDDGEENEGEEDSKLCGGKLVFVEYIYPTRKALSTEANFPFFHPYHYVPGDLSISFQVKHLEHYVRTLMVVFPNDVDFKRFFFVILNSYSIEYFSQQSTMEKTIVRSLIDCEFVKFLRRSSQSEEITSFVERMCTEKKEFQGIIIRSKMDVILSIIEECVGSSVSGKPLPFTANRLPLLSVVLDILHILLTEKIFQNEPIKYENQDTIGFEMKDEFKDKKVMHYISQFLNALSDEDIFETSSNVESSCRLLHKVSNLLSFLEKDDNMFMFGKYQSKTLSTTINRENLLCANRLVESLVEESNTQEVVDELLDDIDNNFRFYNDAAAKSNALKNLGILFKPMLLFNYFVPISTKRRRFTDIHFLKEENMNRFVKTLVRVCFELEQKCIFYRSTTRGSENDQSKFVRNLASKILNFISYQDNSIFKIPLEAVEMVKESIITSLRMKVERDKVSPNIIKSSNNIVNDETGKILLPETLPFRKTILQIFPPPSPLYTIDLFDAFLEASKKGNIDKDFIFTLYQVYISIPSEDRKKVQDKLYQVLLSLLINNFQKHEVMSFIEKSLDLESVFLENLSQETERLFFDTFIHVVRDNVESEVENFMISVSKSRWGRGIRIISDWDLSAIRILSMQILKGREEVIISGLKDCHQGLIMSLIDRFSEIYDFVSKPVLESLRKLCLKIFIRLYTIDPETFDKSLEVVFKAIRFRPLVPTLQRNRKDRGDTTFSKEYFELCESFVLNVLMERKEEGALMDIVKLDSFKQLVWNHNEVLFTEKQDFVLEKVEKKLVELGLGDLVLELSRNINNTGSSEIIKPIRKMRSSRKRFGGSTNNSSRLGRKKKKNDDDDDNNNLLQFFQTGESEEQQEEGNYYDSFQFDESLLKKSKEEESENVDDFDDFIESGNKMMIFGDFSEFEEKKKDENYEEKGSFSLNQGKKEESGGKEDWNLPVFDFGDEEEEKKIFSDARENSTIDAQQDEQVFNLDFSAGFSSLDFSSKDSKEKEEEEEGEGKEEKKGEADKNEDIFFF